MGTEVRSIPTRDQVPEELKWRLEDLFASDADCEKDMAKAKDLSDRLSGFKDRVGESAATLKECIEVALEVGDTVEACYTYSKMRQDEDTSVPKYQDLQGRASALAVQVRSASAFFEPELIAIPDETLDRFYMEEPALSDYKHMIEDVRRKKEHTLNSAEEKIVAMAGEVGKGASNIYTMLNNADIKFPEIEDEKGNKVELTKGRYITFMESKDRRVRERAFEAMYDTYGALINTIGANLDTEVKKNIFNSRVRKYGNAMSASLDRNNIPTKVYENNIKAVRSRIGLLQRYMALRKKLLGVDKLHMWDLYVPMIDNVEMKVPYEEAVSTVKEAVRPLGKEYSEVLAKGLDGRWVDVVESKGKRSGAYSWGSRKAHPYVLMNWQDNINNVFTLAHEMGHAMHSWYTWKTQPVQYSDYPIFLAEVASTFNEALLNDYLLKKITDKGERMYLLNHYLEEFRGTVFRQTMFSEFERQIHEAVENGEALTASSLSDIYHGLNRQYFEPEVKVDKKISLEWARIPHFYMNFYVFQYSTGFCAALALAKKVLAGTEGAREKYIEFLSSGSSDYAINLLAKAGVDMTTEKPINDALDVFEGLLNEMEALV